MQESMDASDVRKLMSGGYVPKRGPKYAYDCITIVIPIPPAATRPNSRGHWARKAKAVSKQREDAKTAAVLQLGMRSPPRWERAEIEATFHRPDSRCRKADADNLLAWLKGTFDGLQDAGIIRNDGGFIHLPPKQLLGKESNGEAVVELKITERVN